LKFLDLINTPVSDFVNLSIGDAFPKLQRFHVESGSNDCDLHVQNVTFSPSLKSLKISRKSMDTFKDVTIPCGNLVNLDLSFNDLLELELDEKLSNNIYELNLSYNRRLIHSIPLYRNKSFSDYLFHNVTQLHLDGCNITNEVLERICDLHDGVTPMVSKLEVLSLAKNDLLNLRCFHSQLIKSTRLRKLDLSFNKFTYLNQDNFPIDKYTFPYIDYINLTGNCSLKSIQGIILDYNLLHVELLNTNVHQIDMSIFPGQNNSIISL
jgi:Leucine-rich repeat (LRR) protein